MVYASAILNVYLELPKRPQEDAIQHTLEQNSGDFQKINAWTQRSKNGAANNIWICTISKKGQQTWSSVSDGGYFNSLEWRQPIMLDSLEIYEGLKINGN